MTTVSLANLRSRHYEAYATQHADYGRDEASALDGRRDIYPLLPPHTVSPTSTLAADAPQRLL